MTNSTHQFPDYLTERLYRRSNSAFIAAAEAENQAALRPPAHITGRERACADPALCGPADNLKVIHTSRQNRRKMQTGVGVAWLEEFSEVPAEAFDQRISPAEIDRTHPPQMTSEMAFLQEVGQNHLVECWGEEIERLPQPNEFVQKKRGNHDVPQTQRWEQDLAEGADIDHPRAGVHPLKRPDRAAGITIFAIVIILDDPGSAPLRPVEQFESSRGRHGQSQRILVRGRDVNDAYFFTS